MYQLSRIGEWCGRWVLYVGRVCLEVKIETSHLRCVSAYKCRSFTHGVMIWDCLAYMYAV